MILSIRTKLFVAIFLACLLAVGGSVGIVQYQVQLSFLDYLNEQETRSLNQLENQLTTYYQETGSWEALKQDPNLWERLLRSAVRSNLFPVNGDDGAPGTHHPDGHPPPPHLVQRLDRYIGRVVLLDSKHTLLQGNARVELPTELRALTLNSQTVGYIGLYPRKQLTERVDQEFADHIQHIVWIAGLTALLVAALASFLLARHLGRPIQALRNGTRQLTNGNYTLRMPAHGQDELGQLTRDFNQLAEHLQQNEQARKQWIADIAHELRTPLSILRGEIEALQDGINQPDTSTFASLHQEVSHLQRLVGDLYDLSMSDNGALSYRKEALDIIALLRETLTLHSTQLQAQNLHIDTLGISLQPIKVLGDPQRLQQLFKNLLENSLRYTDKPGQLRVETRLLNGSVEICFQDSAPGVPDDALPRLFERLFRVEASRNRATGGAGLGLSICRNIVTAHEGTITAAHSALGGLEIRVSLPVAH